MAIFGSDWVEEPTPEEEYKNILGYSFVPENDDIRSEIEKKLQAPYISCIERRALRDLITKIDYDGI